MKVKNILSLILSIGTYVLLHTVFHLLGILWSITAALAVLILTRKIITKFIRNNNSPTIMGMDAQHERAQIIAKEGVTKITKIRNQTAMIKNNDVAKKIRDICKIGLDIFDDLKKNPNDVNRAKPFTNYYLDSTAKIVNQYIDLSNNKNKTPELEESLKKVEDLLDNIEETFKKQLNLLLENDIMDLDTELQVLEKTMKMEG